jgi:subtilase family serine protease
VNTVGDGHCYTPAEMRRLYGVDTLLKQGITGKGRTIAIIVSFGSSTIRSDLHAFDQQFSLPDPPLQVVAPLGQKPPTDPGWVAETCLDVEWAHVIAPGARILLLSSPVDETEGVQGLPQFLTLERYALAHGADVISQSWGATEDTLLDKKGRAIVAKFDTFYASASKAGISFTSGSGDDGAAGLDTSMHHYFPHRATQFPASDPYVIGVGGTQLTVTGSDQRKEVAWDGSGGGFSKLFAEPSYQRDLPSSVQKLLGSRRGVPDVAFNGARASPVLVLRGGRWGEVWGTSAGTPQWAGILALADGAAGRRLGDIHKALYALSLSKGARTYLNDITSGSIKDPPQMGSSRPALHAMVGWDPATGLGTPRAQRLVPALIRTLK